MIYCYTTVSKKCNYNPSFWGDFVNIFSSVISHLWNQSEQSRYLKACLWLFDKTELGLFHWRTNGRPCVYSLYSFFFSLAQTHFANQECIVPLPQTYGQIDASLGVMRRSGQNNILWRTIKSHREECKTLDNSLSYYLANMGHEVLEIKMTFPPRWV